MNLGNLPGRLVEAAKAVLADAPDEYYAERIKNRIVLSPGELAILEWCNSYLGSRVRICEVGPGFGQLSILIAALGHTVTGVEADRHRAIAAKRIAAEVGSPAKFIHGIYPEMWPEHDFLVAGNLSGGWWETQPGDESTRLHRYFVKPSLICPEFWYSKERRNEAELTELYNRFVTVGLGVVRLGDIWIVLP